MGEERGICLRCRKTSGYPPQDWAVYDVLDVLDPSGHEAKEES
jgi:hypothetical protein